MEGVGVVTTSPEGHQRMLRRLKEVRKVLRKSNAASPGADQALGEEEGVGWPLVLLGVSEGVAFVMLEDDAVGDAVGVTVVCVACKRYRVYRRVRAYERLINLSSCGSEGGGAMEGRE